MKVPFLDLKSQYQSIRQEVEQAIASVLESGQFVGGEELRRFEAEFAAYCGVRYGIGTSSGTTALHVALLACEVQPGDEVLTVPNSFIATAEAISHVGAVPVFLEVDTESYTLDPNRLEDFLRKGCRYVPRFRRLINKTSGRPVSAVVPVHLYGQPADMQPIVELARHYNLAVVEDAAQAHGASYYGQRVGSLGDMAAFSFYPGKNLGAYGDGGAVVTDSPDLAERARRLVDHGRESKYCHQEIGYNYRLDNLQAAILRVKLRHLDAWNDGRRQHAARYDELLQGVVAIPVVKKYARHVYHLYVIRTERREELREYLQSQDVATGIHYPLPLHLQPAYRFLGYRAGDFPITEKYATQVLSLPMCAELSQEQVEWVAETIRRFVV